MANKHILYISYDGMTDPLGQSQVLPYLVGLSRLGYHFSLVSCEKPDAFQRRKAVIESICRENNIDWHPLPYTKRPQVISTLLDIRRIRKKCNSILSQKQVGIVHCRSYIPALIGLEIKKTQGIPFIFDMRGFWADEKIDAGAWSITNPIYRWAYRYFKRKEKAFLESADTIITLTEAGKKEILSWKHIQRDSLPITVIPCCADLAFFDYNTIPEQETIDLRKKLQIPEEALVLGYLGSFGTWYMLEEMVLFFRALLDLRPDSYFLVVSNDNPDKLEDLIQINSIPSDRIIVTKTDRENVPLYISLFDIGVFFIRPTYSKIASSPVKHGEMMGMGIPLICNKGVGDVDSIIKKTGTGHAIDGFSADAFHHAAEAIDTIRAIDKQQIRSFAFEYYDLQKGLTKYADIYNSIHHHN
jgi:glycosyltransferase involved in cell wall biosynthesis